MTSIVQAAVIGKTVEPASQLISYYTTAGDEFTFIQITNTNFASGVTLHIQVLDEDCDEVDRFIFLTHNETTVLDVDDLLGNAPDDGIVIINAVAAVNDFVPIEFPFLVGTTWILDDAGSSNELSNANTMGRDLSGGVFEVLQPSDIWTSFHSDDWFASGSDRELDFIAASWTDEYVGGYIASFGSAETTANPIGLFIIDDEEVKDSCGDFFVGCLFVGPPTTGYDDDFGMGLGEVCDKNSNIDGIVQMLEFGYSSNDTNLIALSRGEGGIRSDEGAAGGMDYSIHIGEAVIPTPPPVDCSVGPCDLAPDCTLECIQELCININDCTDHPIICDGVVIDGATCIDGGPIETNCVDGIDNDADGFTDCDDQDFCAEQTICDNSGGGGGTSTGCSVAAATTGLGSMANALVLLIPAFGIGVRRIRRRLSK